MEPTETCNHGVTVSDSLEDATKVKCLDCGMVEGVATEPAVEEVVEAPVDIANAPTDEEIVEKMEAEATV